MSHVLTLSEILGRGISLEWPEAVAIVCGVAECLVSPGQSDLVPDLNQIQLSSAGEIDVAGGTRMDEPVHRLGQLLQATLGNSDPPVQLRLVISQAMAPTPTFGSVAEFNEALGYFERPDRDAVLRALFARAAAAPSRSDATSVPTLNTIVPLSTPEQSDVAEVQATGRRRRLLVVGALALIIVSVGWLQYVRMNSAAPVAGEMSVMMRKASEAVGSTVLSGLSAVTERVGMGRLVSRDAIGEAASTAEAAPSVTTPETRHTPAVPSSTQSSAILPAAQSRLAESGPSAAPLLAFDLDEPAASPVPLPEGPVGASRVPPADLAGDDAVGPAAIYSAESTGVLAPVGVRPQIPTELPPSVNRAELVTIELIVSPDGTVDSVRLLGESRHVHDMMWLSAVKAWQFRPAVKDGRPVTYRKTVWIAPPL